MRVVGVLVRVEHTVEPIHFGIEQLLAQIGRCVDENACDAFGSPALDQERGPPPAIFRIVRIAVAPAQSGSRHAAGRAAAENGEF